MSMVSAHAGAYQISSTVFQVVKAASESEENGSPYESSVFMWAVNRCCFIIGH